ncbi:SDR family NAD(P)-dependent oxidoreductase [Oceanobacillus jeddahense]|uniref:SDR family NAD(P)-dependent oxidoreductase n=1 Tax=Oceanobacillus jeddahense TaxID=1462527 RepID=UPI00362775DC
MKLENKVAIITGAASGIGKETALEFIKEGAAVVVADLASSNGEEVIKEIENKGGKGKFITCDVSKWEDVKNLAEETYNEFGKIDILYNNAGLIGIDSINVEDVEEAYFEQLISVNLKGGLLGTKAVVPYMKEQKSGVILYQGSTSAIRPRPNISVYVATKGGIAAFAKSVALELAEYGIRVNTIHPAVTRTQLAGQKLIDYYNKEKIIPIGRIAETSDIARSAVFLSSDDAEMITGTDFRVDGGRCI